MAFGDPIRTVPPAVLPVTLDELKAQARIDGTDEDDLLLGYLYAAVEMAEHHTGLGLITQTWTQTFSAWPTTKQPELVLRRRPVQSVTQIDFMSDVGSPPGDSVLDPSVYRVLGIGQDKSPARIRLAYGQTWPVLLDDAEAITVTYEVGFGDAKGSVPELIRHAILMAATTWYSFREDVTAGSMSELPFASRALLRDWRPLAVA